MSFFRRDEEPAAPSPAHRQANPSTPASRAEQPVTRIAAGTRITGEISGTTELLIEGEVDGRVRLDGRVVIGQAGGVKGEIQARSVLVAGRVEGPVRGSERVEVGGTGRLEGDIAAPRVTIAEGAFFKGKVEMGGREERRPEARPAQSGAEGPKGPGGGRVGPLGQLGQAGESDAPGDATGGSGGDGESGRGGTA